MAMGTRQWVLAALTCAVAPASVADSSSGFYLGANAGWARNDYNTRFVDQPYQTAATTAGDVLNITQSSVHRAGDAWWADAGYLLSPSIGIDAAFFHLPELTHRQSGTVQESSITFPIATAAAVTSHGPSLSVIGRIPLAESLALELRLGDYVGRTHLESFLDLRKLQVSDQSAMKSSLLAGVGGAYTFAGHWSLRIDALRFNHAGDHSTVGTYNVNLVSAGIACTF